MILAATEKVLLIAEDFWRLPDDGQKHELVAGELTQTPPSGFLHGTVAGNHARLLGEHATQYELGAVSVAEAGFKLRQNPDTVRAPDVAFVSIERILNGDIKILHENDELQGEEVLPWFVCLVQKIFAQYLLNVA